MGYNHSSKEMKVLHFRKVLADMILGGEKTLTQRFFDDKDIKVGDLIEMRAWETDKPFAKVRVKEVWEKKLGDLNRDDWEGHEKFSSTSEMYATYSRYYNRPIGPDDTVKIIRFELI